MEEQVRTASLIRFDSSLAKKAEEGPAGTSFQGVHLSEIACAADYGIFLGAPNF
jgi:hypothetical protein